MTEVWKDIPGYEGIYSVSSRSRVRSASRAKKPGKGGYARKERILRASRDGTGYPTVSLYSDAGRRWTHKIHRLVAVAFIPNPDKKPEVNHINGVRHDNNRKNLEWVTCSEQVRHAYEILGHPVMRGDKSGASILRSPQVRQILAALRRGVRQCVLAEKYGVHFATISAIKRGVSWAHTQ